MARNKFDVDEKLESPFRWEHLKRAGRYIAKHKYKMLLSLILSALASVATLYIPKITQWVLDEAVPNKDSAMIGKMALLFVGVISLSIVFTVIRSRMISAAICLPTCKSCPSAITTAGRREKSWCVSSIMSTPFRISCPTASSI